MEWHQMQCMECCARICRTTKYVFIGASNDHHCCIVANKLYLHFIQFTLNYIFFSFASIYRVCGIVALKSMRKTRSLAR